MSLTVFRVASVVGLLWPCAVLVVSYVAIAWYTSTPWLWSTIVHESGDRTLGQTILYYQHAARELPVDLILGLGVGGSVAFLFPPGRRRRRRRMLSFAAALIVVSAVILVATVSIGGLPMLTENLLQMPTRPGEPLEWGSHWRYHLLSQLSLLFLSFGLAAPVLLLAGRRSGHRRGAAVVAASVAVFAVLTIIFGFGSESLRDPVYLGHQAREVFTHALVGIPLGWGVCLALARDSWTRNESGSVSLAWPIASGAAGVVLALYLAAASVMTSAASQGQSDSLAVLIFPHFFEHVFSYIVTALAAAVVFEWSAGDRG